MYFFVAVALLLISYILWSARKFSKLPPGPYGLPIIGKLLHQCKGVRSVSQSSIAVCNHQWNLISLISLIVLICANLTEIKTLFIFSHRYQVILNNIPIFNLKPPVRQMKMIFIQTERKCLPSSGIDNFDFKTHPGKRKIPCSQNICTSFNDVNDWLCFFF